MFQVIKLPLNIIYNLIISRYKGYDAQKKNILDTASCNSDFLNIGFWDNNPKNLNDASERLCDIVMQQTCIKGNILDIGCGYGSQDFYWNQKYNYTIDAIDISEKFILNAKNKLKQKKIKNINFYVGDATKLPFNNESYNNIICLESAFHYNPRINFFNECYRLLKNKDSELVIADLVLKREINKFPTNIYISFIKDIVSIPSENLITVDMYKKDLEDCGFEVNTINITNNTLEPYLLHLIKNAKYSNIAEKIMINIALKKPIKKMPFEYYIFKCKKKSN